MDLQVLEVLLAQRVLTVQKVIEDYGAHLAVEATSHRRLENGKQAWTATMGL